MKGQDKSIFPSLTGSDRENGNLPKLTSRINCDRVSTLVDHNIIEPSTESNEEYKARQK